jgi:hypothetical protein
VLRQHLHRHAARVASRQRQALNRQVQQHFNLRQRPQLAQTTAGSTCTIAAPTKQVSAAAASTETSSTVTCGSGTDATQECSISSSKQQQAAADAAHADSTLGHQGIHVASTCPEQPTIKLEFASLPASTAAVESVARRTAERRLPAWTLTSQLRARDCLQPTHGTTRVWRQLRMLQHLRNAVPTWYTRCSSLDVLPTFSTVNVNLTGCFTCSSVW